jgi:FkbM family methyltransferase
MEKKEKRYLELAMPLMKKDAMVIDVGACEGQWTDMALKMLPHSFIHCIEPNQAMAEKLNKKYKDRINIAVHGWAASNRNGSLMLNIPEMVPSNASVYIRKVFSDRPETYGKVRKESVKARSLDSILFSKAEYVKIDAEGHELAVLQGMSDMLRFNRVRFVQFEAGGCYSDAKIDLPSIVSFLRGFGYKTYNLVDDQLKEADPNMDIDGDAYTNLLATFAL